MKKKVFVISRGIGYWRTFFKNNGFEITPNYLEADLFQYTGGEDISPELYKEVNTKSHNNFDRDLYESGWFAIGRRLGIPQAGICRGGQFLNVMCGGSMEQDVSGHTGDHIMKTINGHTIKVTSTHHQMMVPNNRAIILGQADIVHECDPEVVLYQREKCLCFQPHPEFGRYPELTGYYFGLINEYLVN